MRRFGGSNKKERKETVIGKILKFFDKYVGISNVGDKDDFEYEFMGKETSYMSMVAESKTEYEIDE